MTTDTRIVRGLGAQLERRRELLDAGAEAVGWKIGFNLPAVQEQVGIDAPVVGFLTSAGLLEPGTPCPLPAGEVLAEAETAIHLGEDVAPEASRDEAASAISGLGPAIELVDRDIKLDDIEAILAGNIFHRAVAFGEPAAGASLAGVQSRVLLDGREQPCAEPLAASGDPVDVVLHIARLLAVVDQSLRAGDRIIAGSMAIIAPEAGNRLRFELGDLGSLELRFQA